MLTIAAVLRIILFVVSDLVIRSASLNSFKAIATVLIPFALAACASTDQQWVREGTPRSEAEQALAECQYQAETATVAIRTPYRQGESWGDAIGQGIGDGVVRGMEESELVQSCMAAKGFTR